MDYDKLLKVVTAIEQNRRDQMMYYQKTGDTEVYKQYRSEWCTALTILHAMTDPEHLDKLYKIYCAE